MSFCFLYNLVSENYSVQNSPWGGGGEGGLLPAQGLKFIMQDKWEPKLWLIFNVCSGTLYGLLLARPVWTFPP